MKIVFLSVLMLLVACGKPATNSGETGVEPQMPDDPYHSRPLPITQNEEVSFHRREQMTLRFNCAGKLVSKKLETINSLSKTITVDYSNRKKAWSYAGYNRRTRSSNLGFMSAQGKIVIDYAPTVFNMWVKEGDNDVEYVFSRCTQIGKDESTGATICKGSIETEAEGIVRVHVNYSSEVVWGEREIRPSADACRNPNF
jgi:hypothetical protein